MTAPITLSIAFDRFIRGLYRAKCLLGLFNSGKTAFHSDSVKHWQHELTRLRNVVGAAPGSEQEQLINGLIGGIGREHGLATEQVEDARIAAYAGALVLAHSALERLLIDLVESISRARPANELKGLYKKQVLIAHLHKDGLEATLDAARSAWIEELDRKPLDHKLHALLSLDRDALFQLVLEQHAGESLVQQLDSLRNEAAHRTSLAFASQPVPEVIQRVNDLGMHLFGAAVRVRKPGSTSAGYAGG